MGVGERRIVQRRAQRGPELGHRRSCNVKVEGRLAEGQRQQPVAPVGRDIPAQRCATTPVGAFFRRVGVRGLAPDEIASLTTDVRIVQDPKKKKDLIEEPDYELQILSQPQGQTVHTHRVIHISRIDLEPFQQDIYDADGKVVTQAVYSNYRKYGNISFPSKIVITRPLDQYSLTVTITKPALNQPMDNDQFDLKIPDTVRAFKEIIEGKHDDVPEQAFYMKGGIEEVLETAEKLKASVEETARS